MHRRLFATFIACFVLECAAPASFSQIAAANPDAQATAEIRALVDRYMKSIDAADPALGATVWSPTPDVSFINPVGHEHGWDEIASEVYGKLMGQTFSQRTLKNCSDIAVHVYGDAAVVEFDWDFVAAMRSNGAPVHSTGRESQVYVKLPGKGWRLVYVHYSGPPVSEPSNENF